MYMNDQPFQKTKISAEALEFARRTRWWFQELIGDLALNTEGPNDRSEAALSGHGIVPNVGNGERAQARIDALSKVILKKIPEEIKKEAVAIAKRPSQGP